MKGNMKRSTLFLIIIFPLACIFIYTIYKYQKNPNTSQTDASQTCNQIKHLVAIMDGNRRWAKERGLKPWIGHKEGVEPLRMTIKFCIKENIPYLTVYAFSIENFKRPKEELDYLFNILAQELASKEFNEIIKEGVKVQIVGDRSLFPQNLAPILKDLELKSKDNKKLNLNILFCYGGQQEIIQAVQNIAKEVKAGKIKPENIDKKYFEQFLWLKDTPAPDLIIRTGKVHRTSNCLTYQSAYSEICFLDIYWPEITEKHLQKALEDFKKCKRTLGA